MTVTMADIAELARVKRPAVSNWRRRHDDFPLPVGGSATVPEFDAVQVEQWLFSRVLPQPYDGHVTYGDVFRSNLDVRGLAGGRGDDESVRSAVALTAVRSRLGRALTAADVPEADLAALRTVNDLVARSGGAAAVERLIATADRGTSTLWATATPPAIAELIAGLVGDVTGRTVCDPAAGVGDLLARVLGGRRPARLSAFDIDQTALTTLRNRLACHDIAAEVRHVDSLRDWPADDDADVVIVDPPFMPGDGQDRTDGPGRWIEHAVAHVRPGGRAFVVVPAWWLSRRNLALHAARQQLLARTCIKVMIQLPRRAHAFRTGTELALLVLTAAGEAGDEIVLCDADRLARGTRETWVRACVAGVAHPEGPGPQRRVRSHDLTDLGSWLPAHRLGAEPVAAVSVLGDVIEAQRRVQESFSGSLRLTDLGVVERRETGDIVRLGTVARLLRGHRLVAEHITDRQANPGRSAVIGFAELRGERPVGSRSIENVLMAQYEAVERTEPGDVVVLAEHGIRAMVDRAGGSVALFPVQIVRPMPRTYPHGESRLPMPSRVLAKLLEAPDASSRESGSLVRRVNLQVVELPELTDEEESRLDDFLAELESRRDQLAVRLASVNRLERTVTEGVASGVLRVVPGTRAVRHKDGSHEDLTD